MDRTYAGWMGVGLGTWVLALEASAVVGLRLARIAAGGAPALTEAQLMVAEKVRAGMEVPAALLGTTPLAGTRMAVHYYRGKVTANRIRLTR